MCSVKNLLLNWLCVGKQGKVLLTVKTPVPHRPYIKILCKLFCILSNNHFSLDDELNEMKAFYNFYLNYKPCPHDVY